MRLSRPLLALASEPAVPDLPVATGSAAEPARTRADLAADARALAAMLRDDRGGRWLVETEDAYRISVAFVAAMIAGARIVLPPNLQPATLAELRAGCTRSFGADLDPLAAPRIEATATGTGDRTVRAIDEPGRAHGAGAATDRAHAIDRNAPLVELYTSGTSGPGKLVIKALRHLEDEVVCLAETFGGALDEAAFVSTVSAHHLYGLLWRVLLPLAAGRPFARTSVLLPDELLARVAEHPRAVIVSSPAHLRHLAASPRLAEHAARIAAIFSSGGPLETRTALELEEAAGVRPVEIFGSTETGGVAWRRTSRSDSAPDWTLLPPVGVSIGEDDRITVTSPFVTPPASAASESPAEARPAFAASQQASTSGGPPAIASWCMGDRGEKTPQGFRLLGRSDRVAKVGEKTLLLPEIEAHLSAHALVEAASLGVYDDRSGARLGALVVLSREGKLQLAKEGRRALQTGLASHIASKWDRVAVPRRWRFLDRLPADARGKIARESFDAEIAKPPEDCREPLVLSHAREGDELVVELVVPRDLAYLEGHYESFALVPGAVQIQWVLTALARSLGRSVHAQRMEAIKFRNVLRPAQSCSMRLALEDGRVTFTLADGEQVFSSGRIVFGH